MVEELSRIAATNVVMEADNIEALPHATPTAVLELMDTGLSPTVAVTMLIRDAMVVAECRVPDLDELRDKIEEVEQDAERYAHGTPKAAAEFTTIRLTTLDPQRPARDMLEDLLSGIRGCWLLYQEYAHIPAGIGDEGHGDGDEDTGEQNDGDADDDGGMSDDALDDAIDAEFCDAVRARASADRYRLDLEPRPSAARVLDADPTDDGREVDVDLEAHDVCEHLVRLVLGSDDWDTPRDIMSSVLELEDDDAGRLTSLLVTRAVGYLVSFKESGITREQLDAAVSWIGDDQGVEYAGPAATVAALAGHPGSQALLAQRLGVDDVTLNQLADFLGADFFPAMIWLCCGMVAIVGDGDVDWLHRPRLSGS